MFAFTESVSQNQEPYVELAGDDSGFPATVFALGLAFVAARQM